MTCFIQLFIGLDFLILKLEVISLSAFNSRISVNRLKLIADKKLFLEQFRYQMIANHCSGCQYGSKNFLSQSATKDSYGRFGIKMGMECNLWVYLSLFLLTMAGDGRLERPAFGSGGQRSIQLS